MVVEIFFFVTLLLSMFVGCSAAAVGMVFVIDNTDALDQALEQDCLRGARQAAFANRVDATYALFTAVDEADKRAKAVKVSRPIRVVNRPRYASV